MKDILEAHIEEIHENTDSLILALLKAIVEDDNINRNRVDNCANTLIQTLRCMETLIKNIKEKNRREWTQAQRQ